MFGKKTKIQSFPPAETEPSLTTQGLANSVMDSAPAFEPPDRTPGQPTKETEENHMVESDLTASVSRNTVFTGNIVSHDNVEIFGEVEGSVTSDAIVKIHGTVHGDIICGVLVAGNATITGNIECEKSAVFGNDTNVNGNITATVVTVSGQINGNIHAAESVSVSSSGAIYGDISTPEIEVSKGAIVFGSVVMEQPEPPQPEPPAEKQEPQPAKPKQDAAKPETGNVQTKTPEKTGGKTQAVNPEAQGPGTAEKKTDHNPFALEENEA